MELNTNQAYGPCSRTVNRAFCFPPNVHCQNTCIIAIAIARSTLQKERPTVHGSEIASRVLS